MARCVESVEVSLVGLEVEALVDALEYYIPKRADDTIGGQLDQVEREFAKLHALQSLLVRLTSVNR